MGGMRSTTGNGSDMDKDDEEGGPAVNKGRKEYRNTVIRGKRNKGEYGM